MPNQEKNIDKIFTDGLNEDQFPYNADAWADMEVLLDRDDNKRRIAYWTLAILLSLVIGFVFLQFIQKEDTYSAINDNVVSTSKNLDKSSSLEKKEAIIPINKKIESIKEPQLAKKADMLPEASDVKDEVTQSTFVESVEDNIAPSYNSRGGELLLTASNELENRGVLNKAILTQASESKTNAQLPILERIELIENNGLIYSRSFIHLDKKIDADFTVNESDVSSSRLSMELLAGPEWSVLGKNSDPKIGNRAGIRIGYYFNNKWSIHTGIVYSKKLFSGMGSEFEDVSFFGNTMPETMAGKCEFLEIPVILRYNGWNYGRHNHFLEGGLTNFNHRTEWYAFDYKPEHEGPDLMKEIEERQVNKFSLGSLRLAYGYSYRISDKLALGVTPYLQIPIKGIGAGNVSIYNSGVEMMIRLRL